MENCNKMLTLNLYSIICFNAHQSIEKALKALAYKMGENFNTKSSNLIDLYNLVSKYIDCTSDIEHKLYKIENYFYSARLPDQHKQPIIPSQFFTIMHATEAIQLAETFSTKVSHIVNN